MADAVTEKSVAETQDWSGWNCDESNDWGDQSLAEKNVPYSQWVEVQDYQYAQWDDSSHGLADENEESELSSPQKFSSLRKDTKSNFHAMLKIVGICTFSIASLLLSEVIRLFLLDPKYFASSWHQLGRPSEIYVYLKGSLHSYVGPFQQTIFLMIVFGFAQLGKNVEYVGRATFIIPVILTPLILTWWSQNVHLVYYNDVNSATSFEAQFPMRLIWYCPTLCLYILAVIKCWLDSDQEELIGTLKKVALAFIQGLCFLITWTNVQDWIFNLKRVHRQLKNEIGVLADVTCSSGISMLGLPVYFKLFSLLVFGNPSKYSCTNTYHNDRTFRCHIPAIKCFWIFNSLVKFSVSRCLFLKCNLGFVLLSCSKDSFYSLLHFWYRFDLGFVLRSLVSSDHRGYNFFIKVLRVDIIDSDGPNEKQKSEAIEKAKSYRNQWGAEPGEVPVPYAKSLGTSQKKIFHHLNLWVVEWVPTMLRILYTEQIEHPKMDYWDPYYESKLFMDGAKKKDFFTTSKGRKLCLQDDMNTGFMAWGITFTTVRNLPPIVPFEKGSSAAYQFWKSQCWWQCLITSDGEQGQNKVNNNNEKSEEEQKQLQGSFISRWVFGAEQSAWYTARFADTHPDCNRFANQIIQGSQQLSLNDKDYDSFESFQLEKSISSETIAQNIAVLALLQCKMRHQFLVRHAGRITSTMYIAMVFIKHGLMQNYESFQRSFFVSQLDNPLADYGFVELEPGQSRGNQDHSGYLALKEGQEVSYFMNIVSMLQLLWLLTDVLEFLFVNKLQIQGSEKRAHAFMRGYLDLIMGQWVNIFACFGSVLIALSPTYFFLSSYL